MPALRCRLVGHFIGEPAVQDDEFSSLRNSLRRSSALRVTEQQARRVIEAFPSPNYSNPPPRVGMTFWQWCARVVPILIALISTGVLAYFLFVGERPQLLGTRQEGSQTPSASSAGAEQDQSAQGQQAEASSDDKAPAQSEPVSSAEQNPIPADLGPRLPMPSDAVIWMLIESAVIALHQANITGNYSVLHDMGAPAFQNANSPEKLAQIYGPLRARKLDLSPILLFQPKLFQKPEMNAEGMIRVTGFFPTKPERINFDLIFQPVNGRWHLFGIAVEPTPAPLPTAEQPSVTTEKPQADMTKPQAKAEPEPVKPPPPPAPKKVKPKTTAGGAASSVDVRDRIDTPPAEKPKQRGGWNPFGR